MPKIKLKRKMWAPKSIVEGRHEAYTFTKDFPGTTREPWVEVEVHYEIEEPMVNISLTQFREAIYSGKTLEQLEREIFL